MMTSQCVGAVMTSQCGPRRRHDRLTTFACMCIARSCVTAKNATDETLPAAITKYATVLSEQTKPVHPTVHLTVAFFITCVFSPLKAAVAQVSCLHKPKHLFI